MAKSMNYRKFLTLAILNISFSSILYYFFKEYFSITGAFLGLYLAELYHRVKIET